MTAQPSLDQVQELLAGYVLGDLSPEETQLLEQILPDHPELEGEIDRLQESLGLLPYHLAPLEPPAQLETAVLQAAEQSSGTRPNRGVASRKRTRGSRWRQWRTLTEIGGGLIAASVIGFLGMDNLRLRQRPAGVVQILTQPNTRLVSLQGDQSTAPQASGSLLFVPGQWQEVVITLKDLPSPPPGQVYRLWARFQDGKLILCGEFEPGADGTIVARLQTRDLPNPGSGLAEVFATVASPTTPLQPEGPQILRQISS